MPGIASSSLPVRKRGSSIARRDMAGAAKSRARLEASASAAPYLPRSHPHRRIDHDRSSRRQDSPGRRSTIATADGPQPTNAEDYFAGKRVALFAVPGAFTPTCSARHLPSYVEKAGELKAKGIDEIACISVNDPFVMAAWGERDGSNDITMLADGNGEFAEAIGLDMDGSKFGMGKRSQRYSMVVNDGVVEQLNVEAPGRISCVERRTHARAAVRSAAKPS